MDALAKIQMRLKRGTSQVVILTNMANLARICQSVGKNANEMAKETPYKVAILTKMANLVEFAYLLANVQRHRKKFK